MSLVDSHSSDGDDSPLMRCTIPPADPPPILITFCCDPTPPVSFFLGYFLGDAVKPSTQYGQPTPTASPDVHVKVTVYASGFTVDVGDEAGPLRGKDEPASQDFMQAVARG